jgi:hypothetical protein
VSVLAGYAARETVGRDERSGRRRWAVRVVRADSEGGGVRDYPE